MDNTPTNDDAAQVDPAATPATPEAPEAEEAPAAGEGETTEPAAAEPTV